MEGKVSRIIGAVVDVEFADTAVPKIHDAIKVPMEDGTDHLAGDGQAAA